MMPRCREDNRLVKRHNDTWDLSWTVGEHDFKLTFDIETDSFRYTNGAAQRDLQRISFQSNIVRSMRVDGQPIAVVNVGDIPPHWQCVEAWYNDGECDCGCGTVDRDCLLLETYF